AWLYGINTLGAAAGAVSAGFVLMPALGVLRTPLPAVAANPPIGVAAIPVAAPIGAPAGPGAPPAPGPAARPPPPPRPAAPPLALFGTAVAGAAALALEVLWTRGIAIAVGGTVYSFTVMLAAFLVGIWLGSWLHAAFPLRRVDEATALGAVFVAIGASSWVA